VHSALVDRGELPRLAILVDDEDHRAMFLADRRLKAVLNSSRFQCRSPPFGRGAIGDLIEVGVPASLRYRARRQ